MGPESAAGHDGPSDQRTCAAEDGIGYIEEPGGDEKLTDLERAGEVDGRQRAGKPPGPTEWPDGQQCSHRKEDEKLPHDIHHAEEVDPHRMGREGDESRHVELDQECGE